MQPSQSAAWKTGLFVVLGLVLATAVLWTIRNPRLLQPGYELTVWLENANGLLPGTPVKLAGVEVGEVRRIELRAGASAADGPPVAAGVWLAAGVDVFEEDRVLIGQLGILGEKYIEILPGPQRERRVAAGGVLVAQPPVTEVALTQQARDTLMEFETALRTFNRLDLDPEVWAAIRADAQRTLDEADAALARLSESAKEAEAFFEAGRALAAETSAGLEALRRWVPWVLVGAAGLASAALLAIWLAPR